jgi:hypothetical protein
VGGVSHQQAAPDEQRGLQPDLRVCLGLQRDEASWLSLSWNDGAQDHPTACCANQCVGS